MILAPLFDSQLMSIARPMLKSAAKSWGAWLLGGLFIAGCWMAWKGISQLPEHYKAIGRRECQAASNAKAVQAVASSASAIAVQASKDIGRAQATGARFERSRTRTDTYFSNLERQASHAPSSPVDLCELPTDRLSLWKSANDGPGPATGPDQGSPASQPTVPAKAPATAGIGPSAGSGSEPSPSGEGVSRTGGPALRPAGLSGVKP